MQLIQNSFTPFLFFSLLCFFSFRASCISWSSSQRFISGITNTINIYFYKWSKVNVSKLNFYFFCLLVSCAVSLIRVWERHLYARGTNSWQFSYGPSYESYLIYTPMLQDWFSKLNNISFFLEVKLLTKCMFCLPVAFREASVTMTFQGTRAPSTKEMFRLGLPSTAALNAQDYIKSIF